MAGTLSGWRPGRGLLAAQHVHLPMFEFSHPLPGGPVPPWDGTVPVRCPRGRGSGLPSLLSWGSLWREDGQAPGPLLGRCPHGVLSAGSGVTVGLERGGGLTCDGRTAAPGTHVSATAGCHHGGMSRLHTPGWASETSSVGPRSLSQRPLPPPSPGAPGPPPSLEPKS